MAVDLMLVPGGGGPTGDPKLLGFMESENKKCKVRYENLVSAMKSILVLHVGHGPFADLYIQHTS